jgi:hypothetical protein
VETFNAETVNEVEGQEEYVHLKSLEDEFHYAESTMPEGYRGGGGGGPDGAAGGGPASPGGGPRGGEDEGVEQLDGREEADSEEAERRYAAHLAAKYGADDDGDEAADGDPGEGADMEDYGFGYHHRPEQSACGAAPVTPRYKLDPAYLTEKEREEMGLPVGEEKTEEDDVQHGQQPRGGPSTHDLFGDRVELDESYCAPAGSREGGGDVAIVADDGEEEKEGCKSDDFQRGIEARKRSFMNSCGENGSAAAVADASGTAGEDAAGGRSPLRRYSSYDSLHEID